MSDDEELDIHGATATFVADVGYDEDEAIDDLDLGDDDQHARVSQLEAAVQKLSAQHEERERREVPDPVREELAPGAEVDENERAGHEQEREGEEAELDVPHPGGLPQPDDDRAGLHMRDDERIDRFLRQRVPRAALGDRDACR